MILILVLRLLMIATQWGPVLNWTHVGMSLKEVIH